MAAHIVRAGEQPKATIADLCDHIEYLASRTGLNHVGIGSDYFGGTTPEGLEDVSKFPHLIAALIERGWSDAALEKLCGGNMLRLMKSVEKIGAVLSATEAPRTGRIEAYDHAPSQKRV